ncbi:hypothetical protein EDD80_10783 [Anseongella ginsenosidimutans]|uniref:Lipoprotein n=1 Tax=Anseongella ginsenosidimutans TaxID=496056 RepID=A0A4R3KPH0_9SPHI|nr:DUF6452 family protein [Anseongella ginsenosidimutans]QEC52627.1 hypothetical protein FRZ59_09945 [Anseongella ginsenosidimutans]TCS86550.1 hypothetical protein EDD80_10783 [Anseongella ginsenosidimutans]
MIPAFKYTGLGAVLFCLLLSACEESACDTSTRTAIQLKFYSRTTDSIPKDTVITLDLEGIYGIGREDSILFEGASVSLVTLPLPLEGDSCQFVMEFPTQSDTLTLTFDRQLRYISKGCGFVTWFTIRDATITENAVRNISIVEPSVTTSNEENIKLYF